MTHYVYALCEPSTGEVRYVGRSKKPASRLGYHYQNPVSLAMDHWLASLHSPPIVKVLSSHEELAECRAEEARIIAALSIGGRLLNIQHIAKPPVKHVKFTGLGERMAKRCEELGTNPTSLARAIGVSQPVLSDLVRGVRHDINSSALVKMARALHTTAEYLVTGEQS